ncbi:uncharacterized protein LOC135373450 [Ornithodoros turicata]|uniref:uncharacterized protein LOC135373450 n=1 Tax=Ornithodoros turicata TaxID=34597 RepID=UPI00313863FA
MSPFFIEKAVASLSKNVTEIKRPRSGDLLLKCTSEADCERILNTQQMLGIKISTLHRTLNTSRGVVSLAELIDVPSEEILENLKSQKVIDVRKIKIRKNNEYITTRNTILTFDCPTLPERLKVGYLTAEVRPYIPNPLRCFKCNRFGHPSDASRGSACCARCSKQDHDSKECRGPDHCVNCAGDHPSYSRSCPKWKFEKEVMHIKVTQKLSYPEARKKASPFLFQKSFSSVVKEKPKMISCATQTEKSTQSEETHTPLSQTPPPVTVTKVSQSSSVGSFSQTPPSSSQTVEASSMECDDDTSSQGSFTSVSLQSQRKPKGDVSRSGSLPDISPKELAAARKKTPRQPIMAPKKKQ